MEKLVQFVIDFLQSDLWIAMMLVYQGILCVFFTYSAFTGAAYGIAVPGGILALGVLLDAIFHKTLFKRENRRNVIMALIFGIMAILIMVYSRNLSPIFHTWISVVLIAGGILGILDMLHVNKPGKKVSDIKQKATQRKDKSAIKEYDEAVLSGITDQTGYMLKPLQILLKKAEKKPVALFLLDLVAIWMGICLLFFRVWFGDALLKVSGVFLIFIGSRNVILAFRAIREKAAKEKAAKKKASPH